MDLAKILDHVATPEAKTERGLLLRLFVLFTIGMPFQFFVSENLRKYLQYSKTLKHRPEFESAYQAIKKRKLCFVATAAFESINAAEVSALRKFRDLHLVKNYGGRLFVRFYYFIGPALAIPVHKIPALRRIVRRALTRLVRHLESARLL